MNDGTEKLSEYLDGDLDAAEREAIERRLATDAGLRELLAELRAVRAAADRAPDLRAPGHLWTGIHDRLGVPDRREDRPRAGVAPPAAPRSAATSLRRRLAFTLPQLAAAAGIVLLLGVGLGRMSETQDAGLPVAGGEAGVAGGEAGVVGSETGDGLAASRDEPVEAGYAYFVRDLERRLEAGRDVLDPGTARVIEESLARIDIAISQAQWALEQDPNDVYLNQHLAGARARKLRLLEDATVLIAAQT